MWKNVLLMKPFHQRFNKLLYKYVDIIGLKMTGLKSRMILFNLGYCFWTTLELALILKNVASSSIKTMLNLHYGLQLNITWEHYI